MGERILSVFIVEDDESFASAAERMVREAGLGSDTRVSGGMTGALRALRERGADVALLDLGLPDCPGGSMPVRALCGEFPSLPVVVMTGLDDEALGVESMKHGAQDYLVKGRFDHKALGRAIRYAMERKELLNDKERLISDLEEALKRVKQLTGLLPICADCKRVRTEKGDWRQLESYISERSEAQFSHGFCDECYKKRKKEIEGL